MYLVREIFQCKPGKAKEIVKVFKKAMPFMEKDGFKNGRIMTDLIASYWTVIVQYEIDKLDTFGNMARTATTDPKVAEIFKGYLDLVEGGKREVFLLE
jgi:hypothetical protein